MLAGHLESKLEDDVYRDSAELQISVHGSKKGKMFFLKARIMMSQGSSIISAKDMKDFGKKRRYGSSDTWTASA